MLVSNLPVVRYNLLDNYRGLAVILMVIFHLCWNLKDFGFVHFDAYSDFWVNFRALIVFMFASAVGWSSYLAVLNHQPIARFLKNQCKVAFAASLITVGTYLALPDQWVFFGILHFIFLAGFIVRPISAHPCTSCLLGLSLIAISFLFNISSISTHKWFIQAFSVPSTTLDFVNPILWLGVVLIGPIFGYMNLHKMHIPQSQLTKLFSFLGKHALLAYLSHQLILYPLVMAAYFIVN